MGRLGVKPSDFNKHVIPGGLDLKKKGRRLQLIGTKDPTTPTRILTSLQSLLSGDKRGTEAP